jgi:hypothetical protein
VMKKGLGASFSTRENFLIRSSNLSEAAAHQKPALSHQSDPFDSFCKVLGWEANNA